jgi:hypothetical protein
MRPNVGGDDGRYMAALNRQRRPPEIFRRGKWMAKTELGLLFGVENGNITVEFGGKKWIAKDGILTVHFKGDTWRVPMPPGTICREAAAASRNVGPNLHRLGRATGF